MKKIIVFFVLYLGAIWFGAQPDLSNDSFSYYSYAKNFAQTGVYGVQPGVPDNGREPGYGIFLGAAIFPVVSFFQVGKDFLLKWMVIAQTLFFLFSLFLFYKKSSLHLQIKNIFVAIALLSPTFFLAHSILFSESLALSLMILILAYGDQFRVRYGILGVLFGLLLITKLYFLLLALLLLLGSLFFMLYCYKKTKVLERRALSLAYIASIALVFPLSWNIRTALSVDNPPTNRMLFVLVGKVYRPTIWNFREEWSAALAASVGSNFCDRKFGEEVCWKYDYRLGDKLAESFLKISENVDGFSAKKEVAFYWLRTFPMQMVGSFLEVLRMVFFEFITFPSDAPQGLRLFGQAWHVLGSALVWALVILGWKKSWSSYHGVLAMIFLGYHILIMSQLTNVQRYIVPVLPCMYLLASWGVIRLQELWSQRARG